MKRTHRLILALLLSILAVQVRADIIRLPEGTGSVTEFKGGNEYIGVPGKTTLKGTAPIRVTGSNVKISGITFDTNGIRRDGNLTGLTVEDCNFNAARVGVEVNGGTNVTIRRSGFDRCSFPTWIADVSNLLIESSDITECGYGFKVFGDNPNNKNWTGRNNYIRDCPNDFMAFEWQGACDGWELSGNFIERIRFGATLDSNDHSLLISAPMAKAKNGRVINNVVLGQKPRDAGYPGSWVNGHPLLLEIGGDNTLVENNMFIGGGTAISVTDKDGACSVLARNNLVKDTYRIWNKDKETQAVTVQNTADGVNVGYTIEAARKSAGRIPVVSIPPATQPDPTPTPAPTTQYVDDPIVEIRAVQKSGRVTITKPF